MRFEVLFRGKKLGSLLADAEGENPVNKDHYSGYTGRPSLGFGFLSNYLSSMSKVCKPALPDGLRYSSTSMKARQL